MGVWIMFFAYMIMYLRTDQVKFGLLKLSLLSSAFLFFFSERCI